jgi:hypothetical protein
MNESVLAEIENRCNVIAVQAMAIKELISRGDGEVSPPPEALRRQKKGLRTYCGEEIEEDEVHFRGAHQRCYKKVNRMINSGTIDESTAIERGWVLPAERGGRAMSIDDPIARYLAEMMGNAEKPTKGRKKR